MAIIYSYPTVTPEKTDLVLGTDVSVPGKPTKNFTVQSIIDLVTTATGDLQFVLNLGNTASGVDINLTNNSFRGGGFVTTGGITISGTTGTGFTNVTSTAFTGTIATPAQPNITSLGTLSALVISGPISGTGLITNSNLTGAQNDNVVSTLAIKTYVDNKVGLYDTLQEVLANGNTTGGSDIVVSAGDDITLTNTSKILMGTTAVDNFEIYSDSANSIVIDRSPGALKLQTSLLSVRNEGDTTQTISASAAGAVELYHAGDKKIETLAGGAKVTGAFQATTSGTFASLVNTGTYTAGNGVGTSGQILSSTGSGTDWVTQVPLYNWIIEADSGTGSPYTVVSGNTIDFVGGDNINTSWINASKELKIDVTGVVQKGTGAATQVAYWTDANTIAGDAGMTYDAGNDYLTLAGTVKSGTFTTTAGTATWSTTVMAGFTSITSTAFIGALTGNASTATALAASGAIALTGDTTSTGGPYTYTSGGAINIATTIADTTVTAKVLTNLPTPTSAAIAASDTILAAMAKLQGQITGIPQGLVYKGTWNATTNTPTLASSTGVTGEFYIVSVAGTTNLNGITDWQVGDWAIFVEVGATDTWQKIDNTSAILGSGTANKIAKWTGSNTLATGLIADDGSTVTIGNSGNLVVEGNTTLGNADTDTTTVKGPAVFEETLRINEGISLGANTYGTAGQVLTSGGGSSSVNTWTTPTTGTVTSVALTETGNALTITGSPVTNSGTINIAGAGSASQYINGALDLVTFPTVDNYVSWTLAGDTGSSQTISSTNTATFAGGFGISTVASATDTLTTAIDITGTDNAIAGLTAATPVATDTLWFNDISDSNTIRKATIASIVDLGNETLAQVLVNGNTTGGTDIAVSAADDITFTDTSKAIFGAGSDLEIYSNGTDGYVVAPVDDLVLQSADDVFIYTQGGEDAIIAKGDGAVELYHNAVKKLETTSAGVTITSGLTTGTGNFSGNVELKSDAGGATKFLRIWNEGTVDATDDALITWQTQASRSYSMGIHRDSGSLTISNVDASVASGELITIDTNGNTVISGNLTVDGQIIHGGSSGTGGGTFTGTKGVTATSSIAFTLKRAVTGTLVFDVYMQLENSVNGSVAKKYTVAHSHNTTPVYNKIIDTGPDASNDFSVVFSNATGDAAGDSVTCNVTSTAAADLGYTVMVGYDHTRVLTFTAG